METIFLFNLRGSDAYNFLRAFCYSCLLFLSMYSSVIQANYINKFLTYWEAWIILYKSSNLTGVRVIGSQTKTGRVVTTITRRSSIRRVVDSKSFLYV
jgi:hypothetical protein